MDSRINEQYISFRICKAHEQILYQREIVRLQPNDPGDSDLKLSFHATYFDNMGRAYPLGVVKIGKRGMIRGCAADQLDLEFIQLPNGWFSLGQDEDYYENIAHLDPGTRKKMLDALQDLAYYNEELDDLLQDESSARIREALLKRIAPSEKVAIAKVKGQFHKMTKGSARLTPYHFTYTAPDPENDRVTPVKLKFDVDPKPYPPTNVHALIGRNGCGKTYLIRNMVRCLQNPAGGHGEYSYNDTTGLMREFVNVICIAFSPFDDFSDLEKIESALPMTFVGLNKTKGQLLETIFEDFWKHFQNCLAIERKQALWKRAIEILKEDELFEREEIGRFMEGLSPASTAEMLETKRKKIKTVFDKLSSGHKVVLLIITSCVAEVEERSILFLDEPENHLHPPLLSALIRALSDLLMDRNGVAIISTHSPIVLQEIPSSCVWVLDRDQKNQVSALRPDRETFGTNLGALIYDIFDLEMSRSGFRRLIREAVNQFGNYDEVCDAFRVQMDQDDAKKGRIQLGNEATLLLRTLIMLRERGV